MPRAALSGSSSSQRPRVWRVEDSGGEFSRMLMRGSRTGGRAKGGEVRQALGVLLGVAGAYYLVFLPLSIERHSPALSALELRGSFHPQNTLRNASGQVAGGDVGVDLVLGMARVGRKHPNVTRDAGTSERHAVDGHGPHGQSGSGQQKVSAGWRVGHEGDTKELKVEGDQHATSDTRVSDFTPVYLFVGCFVFGSYIVWALCAGRPNLAVLRALRRPLFAFQGKDVTGVLLIEYMSVLWSLGCVEAAAYMHLAVLAPATRCSSRGGGGEECRTFLALIVTHLLPSAYFHANFYYNWYMCMFGTRPSDAHAPELSAALAQTDSLVDNEHWSSVPPHPQQRPPAGEVQFPGDASGVTGGGRARSGRGGLGGAWREHYCRACGAVVARADHHCPFLATCIGAHNQAYFVGLLLHMALSMCYGACLIVPPAIACSTDLVRGSPGAGEAAASHLSLGSAPAALRRCRIIAPIGAAILFLACSLVFFLSCVLALLAADLTIRECLLLDLLRYKAGPLVTLRRIAAHGRGPLHALSSALGPPTEWWRLLLPCRRARGYAAAVSRLELPPVEVLSEGGVFWGPLPGVPRTDAAASACV